MQYACISKYIIHGTSSSTMVQHGLTSRTLTCEIVHALHEWENLGYMLVCALQVDAVSIACGQYKHS